MLGAEGCLGIRSSSAAALPPSQGKAVPAQDDHNKNKGKDPFYSDWPELVLLDDFETGLRTFDPSPTFAIGSKYFEDTLWSPICSAEAELVPGSYFDNISFSVDRNESTTLTPKANPTTTESRRQSRNGASDTPLNCDERTSSSSSLSDAELFLQFDDIALANQTGGCEGLEAIFCPSQRAPTPSSTVCSDETVVASSTISGPDFATAHIIIPRPLEKPHDPFRGAPDMVLEEMAENPLDMYFPPVTAYEQPELLLSDSTPAAAKHRSPREIASSYALNYVELQFCSKEMASVTLHGQPSSVVPVKDLGFHKLQEGMNRLDLATKGRIRDALYRLANSVEQRHRVGGSSGGVASSGSKRSGGWTETQLKSNPMDQSVAQLLLQKPSYQKTVPLPAHHVT